MGLTALVIVWLGLLGMRWLYEETGWNPIVQVGSEFSLRDGPTKEDYQEAERMLKDRPKLEKRWKEEAQKERPMSAQELKQLDRWLNDPKVGKQFQKEALEEKKAEQEKYDKAVEEFLTEETLAKRH